MSTVLRKGALAISVGSLAALIAAAGMVSAHNAPSAGHVRFAHKAGTANKTVGFTPIPLKKVSPSATNPDENVARANATNLVLASRGPFTIFAKCFKETSTPSNPGVKAEIYIKTSAAGAIFSASGGDDTSNGFFGPSTPPADRELLSQSSYAGTGNPGTLNISDADDANFYAAGGNFRVTGDLFLGTKVGNPPAGAGVFGPGDRCLFGGTLTSR